MNWQHEHFRDALAAAGDFAWEWNPSSGALALSDNWTAVAGHPDLAPPDTFEALLALLHPEDRLYVATAAQSVQSGEQGRIFSCDFRIRAGEGKCTWVRMRGRAIEQDGRGHPQRVAGTGMEITAQKEQELALIRRSRLLRTTIDLVPDAIYAKDLQRRTILANLAALRLMDVEREEDLLGRAFEEGHGDSLVEHFWQQDADVLSGQPLSNSEERIEIGGRVLWLLLSKVPYFDESGEVAGLVGVARDITALHLAQEQLLELNRTLEARVAERTASLAEAQRIAQLGSWEVDIATDEATLSEEALRIFGLLPGETVGASAWTATELIARFHPDDRNAAIEALSQTARTGDVVPHEFRVIRPDGQIIYVATRVQVLEENGVPRRVFGTIQDITLRREAELAQMRLTAIIDATTDLVGTADLQGHVLYMNRGGRRLLGLAPDADLSEVTVASLYPDEAMAQLRREGIPTAIATGAWSGETTLLRVDGSEIPVSIVIQAHRDPSGGAEYLSTVVRDVTVHKQSDMALRHSRDQLHAANQELEKASRLKDEFLASMSHELRTPLTGILGMSEALRAQLLGALNERQLRSLQLIEESGRHLLALINDILDLSKIEAGRFELHSAPRQLGAICRSCLQAIEAAAHQKHQVVRFSMDPSAIEVVADPRRLKQMLMNLLDNAVKFTLEGGEFGLEVQGDAQRRVVAITVWDAGIGIAPEDLGKLFQPFSQLDSGLSRRHAGTGLGLALVRRLAELHGGSVTVTSTPGLGSRFSILLPWSPSGTQRLTGDGDMQ